MEVIRIEIDDTNLKFHCEDNIYTNEDILYVESNNKPRIVVCKKDQPSSVQILYLTNDQSEDFTKHVLRLKVSNFINELLDCSFSLKA